MGIGYFLVQLNLAIGIIFILIYVSAIAIILISVILVLGSTIRGNSFFWLLIPFLFFLGDWDFFLTPEGLFFFPTSLSSFSLSSIVSDLLVQGVAILYLLSIYFFTVGLFLTGSFFKSLYHKSSTGIRNISLAERWSIPLL
jgi:hypothetical protein